MRLLSVLVAAALLSAACGTHVVNPVSGKAERTVMDEASEIAEGKKAHEEVMKEYGGPLVNPALQAYVNELGQRLAKQSHRANLQWTFTVLDSADVNAFALPGGYVYVTRGILACLDSEADLAGVIGHEIGHVTARHGAQRATKEQRAGAGVMAATVLGVLVEAVTGVHGARIAAGYGGSAREKGQQRYLQAIDGITFGESRDQDVVRAQNFFHEPLGLVLTAPAGWSFANNPEELHIVNSASDAALLMKMVPPAAGKTHEEILRNTFKASQGRVERHPIGGFESTYFAGKRTLEQNQTQPLEATLIDGPGGHTYAFIHAARDAAALERNRAGMRETTASFRGFTAGDRIAARPWTIRSVPLPAGGFAELARRSPLGTQAQAQLKLLNGIYAGGEVAPGRLVKVVE